MTRIIHLSDLHFGYERAELLQPLLKLVNAQNADLVVVTGDITHRSLIEQWKQAADFLAQLDLPWVAVPGNHDIPLFNPVARWLMPFAAFRRWLQVPTDFQLRLRDVQVHGVNSADRWAWERGRIGPGQVDEVTNARLPEFVDIVALHHPLQQLPQIDKALARGADHALQRFQEAGVGILLSGHLHRFAVTQLLDLNPHILQVHGGTALCRRKSDLQNEFAVLDLSRAGLHLQRFVALMGETDFGPPQDMFFERTPSGWVAQGDTRPLTGHSPLCAGAAK